MKKTIASRSLFSVDVVKKTITASAATLSRAKNPNSNEYVELGLLLADHPGFKVKEKATNKTTYDGLTFKFMRDYILIQDDRDELMDEFEAVKAMAAAARDENDALRARIEALEAKLGDGGAAPAAKPGKAKKGDADPAL